MRMPLKVILFEIGEYRPNRCEPALLARTCPAYCVGEHAFSLSFIWREEEKGAAIVRKCGTGCIDNTKEGVTY
jgi:hypothetical protein